MLGIMNCAIEINKVPVPMELVMIWLLLGFRGTCKTARIGRAVDVDIEIDVDVESDVDVDVSTFVTIPEPVVVANAFDEVVGVPLFVVVITELIAGNSNFDVISVEISLPAVVMLLLMQLINL